MKTIKLLPLLIVALLTVSLSSCGGKGKSTSVADRERAMVGMWRCDYDDDYSIRTYYEDGTGIEEHRFYRKSQEYESKSIYYIDQKDNKMKIVDSYIDDYDGQRYTQEYTVAYINDYEMRLDGHKGPHIYHRIK